MSKNMQNKNYTIGTILLIKTVLLQKKTMQMHTNSSSKLINLLNAIKKIF